MNEKTLINKSNRISVVIATYYRHDTLKNVLKLFEEQTIIPDEFVIVDQTPNIDIPDKFYDNYNLNIKLVKPEKTFDDWF